MKRINIWDLWQQEWVNANKFFNCKGNIKTKSRQKDKWYKEFKTMLIEIETTVRENTLSNKKEKEVINIGSAIPLSSQSNKTKKKGDKSGR